MTSTWIDFRELRSRLRLADLLKSYKVELRVKGQRATGFCPLPGHPRHDGKRHSPSFSANLDRGLFQCFGCGAKGNVLDFAAYMEGVDPADTRALRDVAIKLQDRFGLVPQDRKSTPPESAAKSASKANATLVKGTFAAPAAQKQRVVNVPIDFELKHLDSNHPYLSERGLSNETIAHFGLGYCSRGLMAERIAIPLHDGEGKLVGYAGRLIDDERIDDEHPKYRFPGEREKNGVIHEFKKSLFLFNGHQIVGPVHDLVVVEGFASTWWLWQNGFRNTVALMGSSCSNEQANLILNLVAADGRVWILPDGDEAGDRLAGDLFSQLAPHRFVRWVQLKDGLQPTDRNRDNLSTLLPLQHVVLDHNH